MSVREPPTRAVDPSTFGARVSIRAVEKVFGSVRALQPTNLEFARGEFVTLLGPSGCGKSTLLRIIAGLEQPTRGRVFLDDVDVTHLPPERRQVNLVFQSYALFPHLNVLENVAYGLRAAHLERQEREQRVAEALAVIELSALAKRRIGELSGGQSQRVALARALVNRPSVLLLDEPLAALDVQLRKQMQVELRRIHRTFRTTFVYVTHDQSEALAMSDRVVVMNHGVVEQVGTPEEVYRAPISAFVASFVGEGSLVPGTLLQKRGELADVQLDSAAAATVEVRHQCHSTAVGARVFIVLRPGGLSLVPPEAGQLRGRLSDFWFVGDRYLAVVEVAIGRGEPLLLRIELPAQGGRPKLLPGDDVGIDFYPDTALAVPEAS